MLNRRIKSILGHLARFQIEQKFSKVVNEFYIKTTTIFWKKKITTDADCLKENKKSYNIAQR